MTTGGAVDLVLCEVSVAQGKYSVENESHEISDWVRVVSKQTDDLLMQTHAADLEYIEKELVQVAAAAILALKHLNYTARG